MFIHGGWWRSLDKSDFTFIVPGYHEAGFNVALTNYTLAPKASIEEITPQQPVTYTPLKLPTKKEVYIAVLSVTFQTQRTN